MLQGPYVHQGTSMVNPNYMLTMMTKMLNEYKEHETVSTYITRKPYPLHVDEHRFHQSLFSLTSTHSMGQRGQNNILLILSLNAASLPNKVTCY